MKIQALSLRNEQGLAFLSYGFRPFFLAGALYSGLAIAIWMPVYFGELTLHTAFAPLDWHIHEMLFGFLPAVIAGFLLTAIPNWTGRPPVRGNLLLLMAVVWVCGRVAVACSGQIGWRAAMLVDASFLLLVGAVAAREVLAAKNLRNMRVVALVLLLFACNVAFHIEAHVQGAADYSVRAGIAIIVLLISVIAGRIVPAFTRIWLMRRPQGPMPVPFSRFDGLAVALGAAWRTRPCRLDCAPRWNADWRALPDSGAFPFCAACALGRLSHLGQQNSGHSAHRLCLRAAGLCSGEYVGVWRCRCQRSYPCVDGGRGGHHDARGDVPGKPWAYWPPACGVRANAGLLWSCRGGGACQNRGGAYPGMEQRPDLSGRCLLVSFVHRICAELRAGVSDDPSRRASASGIHAEQALTVAQRDAPGTGQAEHTLTLKL